MDALLSTLEIILPIAATLLLGVYARRTGMMSGDAAGGMQRYAIRFGLPCVMFTACLTGDFGAETVTSVALVTPVLAVTALLCFRARRRGGLMAFHNLPALLATQESGMLGIPLFLLLFGPGQVYRMAALNMAQGFISIPLIAILSAQDGKSLSPGKLLWKTVSSPLLLAMVLGLALNLSGGGAWLDASGIGPVLTATADFIATPVSAVILFSIGYNFSLSRKGLPAILQVCSLHLAVCAALFLIVEGGLFLVPNTAAETRWAVLLFCLLPAGYIAPGLGRDQEEYTLASGVCSLTTVVTMAGFLAMTVFLGCTV